MESSTRNITLQELNEIERNRRLPVIVYISLLIVIGIPGNFLVLWIYFQKFKKSTHRTFILGLAFVDLASCSISMPFEISDMLFQYTFYTGLVCKTFRFLSGVVSITSLFIVMALSLDRYLRICRPLKRQMTVFMSKCVCCSSVVLSGSVTWPVLVVSGIRTVHLEQNITGYDCSVADAYQKTNYPMLGYSIITIVFIIIFSSVIAIYILIAKTIFSQRRFRKQFQSTPTTSFPDSSTNPDDGGITTDTQLNTSDINIAVVHQDTCMSRRQEVNCNMGQNEDTSGKSRNKSSKISLKITKLAFIVTMTSVVSYIPYFTLTIITALKKDFVAEPGPVASVVFPIITRTPLIQHVVNPIIYGVSDDRFREALRNMFSRKTTSS